MRILRASALLALCGALGGACLGRPIPEVAEDDGSSGEPDPGTTTVPLPADSTGPVTPPVSSSSSDEGDTTSGSSTGPVGPGEGEPCDLYEQECAPGLKCMPYSVDADGWWDHSACFPIDPDAVEMGDPCQWFGYEWSGYDNCGPGQFCSTWEEPAVCRDLCKLEPGGEPDVDVYCPSPMTAPVACQDCFCSCIATCDPLVLDACPMGQACLPIYNYDGAFVCGPDASGDMGAAGDPCEFVNVCDPGLVCVTASLTPGCVGLGCCSPLCDVTLPNTCPFMDQECLPWWGDETPPAGYEDIGVCGLPQ